MSNVYPGKGYRYVANGEMLLPGDEYFCPVALRWCATLEAGKVQGLNATGFDRRRRIEASTAAPAPVGNVYPPPVLVACGCAMHSYPQGADPYAEHRDFVANMKREQPMMGIAPPIVRPLTVLSADPTGDDVAPDAQRTTGGKTLDSVIDEHRNCFEIKVGEVTWHKE